MVRGIIYKWTNKINNKVYIGKTINEKSRIRQHKNSKKKDHFHNAIRKYGFDNFSYEVIFKIFSNERWRVDYILNVMEKYFIKEYDSYINGYNSTLGGDGNTNTHLPDSWKNNISKALLGNNYRKGKKFTEEQLQKLKLRKHSVMSEDGKKRLKQKLNKVVYQYTLDNSLVAKYKSVLEAAEHLNSTKITKSGIARACRGELKTAYGYKWSYINHNKINKDNVKQEEINDEEG